MVGLPRLHGGEEGAVLHLHPAPIYRDLSRHGIQLFLDGGKIPVLRNARAAELSPGLSGHHAVGAAA